VAGKELRRTVSGDVTGIAFFAGYAGGTAALDGQLMVVRDVDRVPELAPKTSLAA